MFVSSPPAGFNRPVVNFGTNFRPSTEFLKKIQEKNLYDQYFTQRIQLEKNGVNDTLELGLLQDRPERDIILLKGTLITEAGKKITEQFVFHSNEENNPPKTTLMDFYTNLKAESDRP